MKKITKTEKFVPMEVAGEVMKLEKLKREVDDRLKEYKAQLLDVMKQLGVKSLKTEEYTLYRTQYKYVDVKDHAKAIEALQKREIPTDTKVVLDMDTMKVPLDTLVKKQGEVIDGVELSEREYVGVRLTEKKEE